MGFDKTLYGKLKRYLTVLELENKRPNTLRTYESRIKSFLSWLRAQNREISGDALIDFLMVLSKERNLRPTTVKSYVIAIKTFFDFLDMERPKVKAPKIPQTPPKFLTKAELKRFYESIDDPLLKTMVSVCYATGMRDEELRSRKYKDFDMRTGTESSVFVSGKTGPETDAWLPLTPTAVKDLKRWLKDRGPWRPDDYVFFWNNDKRKTVPQKQANTMLHRALIKAGLKRRGWHQFRHSRATHLSQDRVPIEDIKELLRHTSIKTTLQYRHSDTEMLREKLSDKDTLSKKRGRPRKDDTD